MKQTTENKILELRNDVDAKRVAFKETIINLSKEAEEIVDIVKKMERLYEKELAIEATEDDLDDYRYASQIRDKYYAVKAVLDSAYRITEMM